MSSKKTHFVGNQPKISKLAPKRYNKTPHPLKFQPSMERKNHTRKHIHHWISKYHTRKNNDSFS